MENKTDSIEWHKDNLKNQILFAHRLEKELKRKVNELQNFKDDTEFYELQIETAVKKKKAKFCRERFLKKGRQ